MIPTFLVTRFGAAGAKAVFFGGIALALLLVALGIYLLGRSDGKTGEQLGAAKREIVVQGQVKQADSNASAARVEDTVHIQQQRDELHDILQATQDPDRQRALRGCVILRQQGRDTSRIPGCIGSASRP